MALKKPSGDSRRRVSGGVALGGGVLDSVPLVVDFLCCPTWDDGSARQVGSMTLFCDDGTLKACVNDKEAQLMLFVSGGSLEALLGALEEALRTGGGDWRPSNRGPRKDRR